MNIMGAIHAVLRDQSIDKEDARDRFHRVTGERSLRAMNEDQRRAVLKDLKSTGVNRTSKASRTRLDGPFAKKLQALWIAGWNLGLVKNRQDRALLAFVKRQTGIDHTRFLRNAHDGSKVIEALKGWLSRNGRVNWETDNDLPDYMQLSGYKIAIAQIFLIHHEDDLVRAEGYLASEVHDITGRSDFRTFSQEAQWIPIMNALGSRIRNKRVSE